MLYESSNSAHHNFAWDTGPQVRQAFVLQFVLGLLTNWLLTSIIGRGEMIQT